MYTSDKIPPPHPTSINFSPSKGLVQFGSFLIQNEKGLASIDTGTVKNER